MAKKYSFKKTIEEMSAAEVKKQQLKIRKLNLGPIETLDFVYNDSGLVTYETEELSAVCPMTGLPDQYTLVIEYLPAHKIPELKSLKLYLIAYRDLPILHEHLACKLYDDFTEAVAPGYLRIELISNTRGGIDTTVVKESE